MTDGRQQGRGTWNDRRPGTRPAPPPTDDPVPATSPASSCSQVTTNGTTPTPKADPTGSDDEPRKDQDQDHTTTSTPDPQRQRTAPAPAPVPHPTTTTVDPASKDDEWRQYRTAATQKAPTEKPSPRPWPCEPLLARWITGAVNGEHYHQPTPSLLRARGGFLFYF
jgi:hypothetical protein